MKTKIIKSIFLFCMLHFAFCISSNAQIVYTDVVPDFNCNTAGCTYNLDLNNDSINDFTINLNGVSVVCPCGGGQLSGVWQIALCSAPGNEVVLYNGKPAKLNFGDTINSVNVSAISGCPFLAAYTHMHCQQGWCAPDTHVGNWGGFPATDHYLGLMIKVGNDTLYGWARLLVYTSSNGFIIRDYAYNSFPNQYILAGDTGNVSTGTIHLTEKMQPLLIYPNPFSTSTLFSFSLRKSQKVSLKIFDLNDRLVSTLTDKNFEEGEHQIEFNAEKINAGIYFLKMQAGEFLKTEKLIVTK